MVSINQLIKNPRRDKIRKLGKLALKFQWNSLKKKLVPLKKPQISGIIKESGVKVKLPRKPNSANRACAKVLLSNKKVITAYIPGEKHTLQGYSSVLIKGDGPKDVPGVRFTIIRGHADTAGVENRKQGRSIYGTKRSKE